jgi:Xaa-Pro aminopeptidase
MAYGRFAVDYEQRAYNPERMRLERLERAQAMLKKYGLGAMICYNYDNHRYLGYYSTHQYARRRPGTYVLLIRDAGFPYVPAEPYPGGWEEILMPWLKGKFKLKTSTAYKVLQGFPQMPDFPEKWWTKTAEEIKSFLKEHGVLDLPVGIDEAGNVRLIRALEKAGVEVVDGNHVMTAARVIKTQDEIECLRFAGVIAEAAHWEVCRNVKPGMTEWQVAGIAAKACFDLGAEELEGPSFVICSGERSGHSVPNMPTDRVIRPGDLLVIDINGVSFQGYRTCFYRTYCVGAKPTEFQKMLYKRAYDALMALTNSIKPGLTNYEIQKIWEEKGQGEWWPQPKWPEPGFYYYGSLAHPIGLCSGDPGPIIPGAMWEWTLGEEPEWKIEKNMCFAVEAACFYWDGKRWARDGVKLEHCGVVTDTGFEVFYRFPVEELLTIALPGTYI